jgi:hypothetical protein
MGLNSLRALGKLKSHFKGFQAIFKQMDLFLMVGFNNVGADLKLEAFLNRGGWVQAV